MGNFTCYCLQGLGNKAIDLVGQAQTLLDQAATTDQELAAVAR